MLTIMLFVLGYLLIGTMYSRHRYNALYVPPTKTGEGLTAKDLSKELESLKKKSIEHTFSCPSNGWFGEEYRIKYCKCGVYKSRDKRIKEVNDMLDSGDLTTNIPGYTPSVVGPIIGWLGYAAHDFVTKPSKQIEQARAKELAEAKHNLEIAKLKLAEDEMLTKQLEGNS